MLFCCMEERSLILACRWYNMIGLAKYRLLYFYATAFLDMRSVLMGGMNLSVGGGGGFNTVVMFYNFGFSSDLESLFLSFCPQVSQIISSVGCKKRRWDNLETKGQLSLGRSSLTLGRFHFIFSLPWRLSQTFQETALRPNGDGALSSEQQLWLVVIWGSRLSNLSQQHHFPDRRVQHHVSGGPGGQHMPGLSDHPTERDAQRD